MSAAILGIVWIVASAIGFAGGVLYGYATYDDHDKGKGVRGGKGDG